MAHVATTYQSNGGGWPLTISLNFGSNADRWVVATVTCTGAGVCTSLTVNGVSMTERASGAGLGGGTRKVYEGSVAGTGSLTVTATGSGSGIAWMTVSSYDGISGYRTSSATTTTATSSVGNITVTSQSGDICWAGGDDNTSSSVYAASAGTTARNGSGGTGQFAMEKTASGTSTQIDWTVSPSTGWGAGALALIPAGGGGGSTVPIKLQLMTGV